MRDELEPVRLGQQVYGQDVAEGGRHPPELFELHARSLLDRVKRPGAPYSPTVDGVWEAVRTRTDYAALVPRPRTDIERADLRKRDGTPYTVLKNPAGDSGAGTYVRLEGPDVELYELMDGRRTTSEIIVAYLERKGVFALDRLARLTAALGVNGFFGEQRLDAYRRPRIRRARRDPIVRMSGWLRRLVVWNIATWNNAEGFVDVLYRAGGGLAFTRAGATVVLAFSLFGLGVWLREFTSPRHQLFTVEGSFLLGLLALILLQVLAITVHEAGHALAIRHYGRRVRQLGVALYYLFPCVYVDSTDMTLASRRQRVVVSLAGPLAGVAVAGACALVAAAQPETLPGAIAFKAATLLVFQFVINLLPILELDGYHVLVDALDVPLLRQRALGFVRGGLTRKLRRRERWSRAELGLALYGVLAIAVSLVTLGFSLWIWESRLQVAARELLRGGVFGVAVLALLVVVFVGPLLLALVARLVGLGRTAMRTVAARRRQAHENVIAERVALLDRIRFLRGLPRPALAAIADHLVEERFAAGDIVVTYGEPGDRFYLVRSGRLEVLLADGEPKGAMIVPGEGFGELALLDRVPRSATVRATEPTELWSLDRGHFHRWVAERYEVAGRIRASVDERDTLARLPFFRGLDAMELTRIAARMRTERVSAGDAVFAEGERADRYFVIRSGEAEIRSADGGSRRIGPGEGFGEMGLLYGRPRGATVVAATDLVLSAIDRADFGALVRASGETVGEFRARTAHYLGAGLAGAVGGG